MIAVKSVVHTIKKSISVFNNCRVVLPSSNSFVFSISPSSLLHTELQLLFTIPVEGPFRPHPTRTTPAIPAQPNFPADLTPSSIHLSHTTPEPPTVHNALPIHPPPSPPPPSPQNPTLQHSPKHLPLARTRRATTPALHRPSRTVNDRRGERREESCDVLRTSVYGK